MPTITVGKDKLELAIAKKCGYFQLTDTGKPLCHKPRKGECNLDVITKIELDCPYDCPHRDEYFDCNPRYIKKTCLGEQKSYVGFIWKYKNND